MDFFLVEKIAVLRLQQRCLDLDRANHLFRIDRQTGVIVPHAEWSAIGAHFLESIRGSARVLRWSILLQIPVALVMLSLVAKSTIFASAWDMADGVVPGLFWLILSTMLPVAGLLWHGRNVGRRIDSIVVELAMRARQPAPLRVFSRGVHLIEVVALVLFGPGVFIALYSSIFPHAFDNTPWMGRRMDWDSIVGVFAFAIVVLRQLWLRLTAGPLTEAPDPPETTAPAMLRRRALVARIDH